MEPKRSTRCDSAASVRKKPPESSVARPRSRKSAPAKPITPEERHEPIAATAYFRAERRGFAGGSELEDRLAAEAGVEAMLVQGQKPKSRR